MKLLRAFGYALLFASCSYGALAGTIAGKVNGPDGTPFMGAFVRARQDGSNITVNVLSDKLGGYRIQNLAPGTYRVWVTAVGFKGDSGQEIKVVAARPASMDFLLQKAVVHWTDLSIYQGRVLLPDGPGKYQLFLDCQTCHGYMYMVQRLGFRGSDLEAWRAAVSFMRDVKHGVGDRRASDQDADLIASYLNSVFGRDSKLPEPGELPGYEKVRHEFSDQSTKIIYVEYKMQPGLFAWDVNPDKHGDMIIPLAKLGNGIARLNPETGKFQVWHVPQNPGMLMMDIHSAVMARDGMIWYVDVKGCKLGELDPKTQKFTEYLPPGCSEGQMGSAGVTLRVDRLGYVWGGDAVLFRFDPETRKFKLFPQATNIYGIDLDNEGNVWFASWRLGQIGRVNIHTLKLSIFTPPTTKRLVSLNKGFPDDGKYGYFVPPGHPKSAGSKRIAIAPDGNAYFGEWYGGKDEYHSEIGRFDPKTNTFTEYPLPGPGQTPYAVGVDRHGFVWYNSSDNDVIGRLDPKTGAVVEYPFPHSDNGVRELNVDSEGRIWYASGFNDVVGYFLPPD